MSGIPIGTEVLLRQQETSATTAETCGQKSGYVWTTGTPAGDLCLTSCPDGYTAEWDKIHGALCRKTGTGSTTSATTADTSTQSTAEAMAQEKLAELAMEKASHSDVFFKAPPKAPEPTKDVLFKIANFEVDTPTALVIAVGLGYLFATRA